jgi:hypothetical protein
MRNILPKLLAIGLLGGGFTATGDLGWLARRGMRLLEASTVPTESAALEPGAEAAGYDPVGSVTAGFGSTDPGSTDPGSTDPGSADPVSTVGPAGPASSRPGIPPADGPAAVDLAALMPGARLVVWVMNAGTREADPVTLDLIDPARGAALLHRGGEPPRRVRVVSDSAGLLGSRGGVPPALAVRAPLLVQPLGLAHGVAGQTETCGRIVAFATAH